MIAADDGRGGFDCYFKEAIGVTARAAWNGRQ